MASLHLSSAADSSLPQLTDRLKDSGLENIVAGVKNFLPVQKDLTVTRLVASLLDPAAASAQVRQETDDWLSFDMQPRRGRQVAGQSSATGAGAKDAIVFVVGGGSYVEYTDLVELCARSAPAPGAPPRKRITYGATEILRPGEFLSVLGALA